jgi:Tol biopolymer transport system component
MKKKITVGLLLLVIVTVCSFRFTPMGRVKATVRAYNRWSDPGLIDGQGLGGLIDFFFLNRFSSSRLKAQLADDCRTIYVQPDGTISTGKGKDIAANLTGLRFTSSLEQIVLEGPEITKKEDGYWVEMKKAFYEGNSIMIVDAELVIRDIDGTFLISEIKRTGRNPSGEELDKVKSISHKGGYNYNKGFRASNVPLQRLDYSPDGSRIVFTGYNKNGRFGDIYLMATDGTGLMRLTDSKYCECGPYFTPDGQSILFYCDRDNYAGEPYLIDIDGSNYRRLLPDRDGVSDVVYSPDGKYIAFTVQQGLPKEVYVMENASGKVTQLTHRGRENSRLLFSSSGNEVFFNQKWHGNTNQSFHQEIFVVSAEGGNPRQLTDNQKSKTPVAVSGDTLFYSMRFGKGNDSYNVLWSIKSDGSENEAVISTRSNGNYRQTQVVSGGNMIVFINDINRSYDYQIYSKHMLNGKLLQLTDRGQFVQQLTSSPSGDEIVYTALPRNKTESGGCGKISEIYKLAINNDNDKEPILIGKIFNDRDN